MIESFRVGVELLERHGIELRLALFRCLICRGVSGDGVLLAAARFIIIIRFELNGELFPFYFLSIEKLY